MKLREKNRGNVPLVAAIDRLINDLEQNDFENFEQLKELRPDADRVHNDGFCFLNLNVHRTMVLFHFGADGVARFVWAGTHQEYEATFKNNKNTIEKWLRRKGMIN